MPHQRQELWTVFLDLIKRHDSQPLTDKERADLIQYMRQLTDQSLSLNDFFSMTLDNFFERHDPHTSEIKRKKRVGYFKNLGIIYLGELLHVYRAGQIKNHETIIKKVLERVLRKTLPEIMEAALEWRPFYWEDRVFLSALQNPLRNSPLPAATLNGLQAQNVFLFGELLNKTDDDPVVVFLNNTQRILELSQSTQLRAGMLIPSNWQPDYPEEVLLIKAGVNESVILEKIKQVAEEERKQHVANNTSPYHEFDSDVFSVLCKKIEELELSTRAINALQNNGIEVIGQLVRINQETMKPFRGCGPGTINEIEAELEKHGLSLGMDLPAEVISLFPL